MTAESSTGVDKERAAPSKVANSTSRRSITRNLHQLLCKLALPLLGVGITPRQFSEIAARAFVEAACNASTLRNGRVNQSRVAVLTGLSRPEVRKLLSLESSSAPSRYQRPRTLRVIDGWLSDRRFHNNLGRPCPLRLKGTRQSFAALAKKYAGDVPYRAVLHELQRMKAVRLSKGYVTLISASAGSCASALRLLSSLLPLVADSISDAASGSPTAQPAIRQLTLRAADVRDLKLISDRIASGAESFLNGLDRSLQNPTRPYRSSRKLNHQIRISILVNQK
jgi:hypothetical protein